jgi:hypothetical protein
VSTPRTLIGKILLAENEKSEKLEKTDNAMHAPATLFNDIHGQPSPWRRRSNFSAEILLDGQSWPWRVGLWSVALLRANRHAKQTCKQTCEGSLR